MQGSVSKSRDSSTSCLMSASSAVAKNSILTRPGIASIIALAHSRLMATVSSLVGGTRAGARALSGKIALLIACSTGGRTAGLSTRSWKWYDNNLQLCQFWIYDGNMTCLLVAYRHIACMHKQQCYRRKQIEMPSQGRSLPAWQKRLASNSTANGMQSWLHIEVTGASYEASSKLAFGQNAQS